ncbi:hypothetical protein PAMA_006701 [Pampus argenteus]
MVWDQVRLESSSEKIEMKGTERFPVPPLQDTLCVAQRLASARGQLAQRKPQMLLRRQSGSSQSGAVRTSTTEKLTNGR